MKASQIAVGVLLVMVVLSGCMGATQEPGAANETGTNASETDTDTGDGTEMTNASGNGSEASYRQKAHMGCQPGAIKKDGTCQVAVSNENAEIFSAENLTPITATNTTLGGTPGYLARPADNGSYPGVVMIHEWWGLNDNIRHMADVLAGHGYTVFAVDLYNGRVATNSSRASELASQVRSNADEAVTKLVRATEALRSSEFTTSKVASLGWCFGGGWSLQLSLSDADLNSTVIYYGTLTTNTTKLREVDAPVLGIFGSEDQVVGIENIREFNRTLSEIGVEKEIRVYEGASHAFANPSGESFRPNATKDAWRRTLEFLNTTLNQ